MQNADYVPWTIDVYKFENGLAELVILPNSVYGISERSTMIITLIILAKISKTS